MAKKFGEMTLEEQTGLCEKISECLKDNDLANVGVDIYREAVCQLTTEEVKGRTMMRVEKSLPSA